MMRTYRGVVFEIDKKYTVFLTEKGEFLRGIPIGETPNIGDEVDFHLMKTAPLLSGKGKARFVSAVMIAAVLLISIIASLIPMNNEVMAYVQLETDTAVELGVNQTGKVIVIRYLNDLSVEPEDSLDRWKGDSISKVLDTALKKLSTKDSGEQVNITIIYENSKKQSKVQKVIGSAIRELQDTNKELTVEIGESTAEERIMANQHEMSVNKFQKSQQVSPKNELKSSSKIDDKMNNPINELEKKDTHIKSTKESIHIVPFNEKGNGNGNEKESSGQKNQKSNGMGEKPERNQNEKTNNSPIEKGNSNNPEPTSENSNKGNQSPTSNQPKENKIQQEQPKNANSSFNKRELNPLLDTSKIKDQPNSP